jgi:hypothetical protein
VKTFGHPVTQRIFDHAGSISRGFLDSNHALPHLDGMLLLFLHGLDPNETGDLSRAGSHLAAGSTWIAIRKCGTKTFDSSLRSRNEGGVASRRKRSSASTGAELVQAWKLQVATSPRSLGRSWLRNKS